MDRAGDTLGDVRRRLDSAPKLVHLAHPCQRDAVLAHLVEPAEDRLDRAREHVHAAHGDHVVHAAGDAAGELHLGAPAGAGTPHGRHAIPRAIADDGHAPSAEIGEEKLAVALITRLAGRRVDHLGDELRFIDVDAVTRGAREAMRTDFGRPGVVECLDPKLLLNALACRRNRGAGLSGVNRYPKRGAREVDALFARRLGQAERVRRRAHKHGGLGGDDRRHALRRRHRAAGEAHRPKTLGTGERRPEADERPKRECEEDAIPRGDARRAVDRLPALPPPFPGFGGVEKAQRPPGRTARLMETDIPLERISEIRAEGWPRSLILGELGLRGEWQVAKTAHAFGQSRAIERVRPAKLGQLCCESLPLRAPPLPVGPCFECVELAHRCAESTDARPGLGIRFVLQSVL